VTARAAGLACAAALVSLGQPAAADGPALALLTLDGVTLTLTESAPPAIGDGEVTLSFAQMHLGFPLPPRLSLTLRSTAPGALFSEAAETSLARITLNGAGDGTGTALGHETYIWFEPAEAVLRPADTADRAPEGGTGGSTGGGMEGGALMIETQAIARTALGRFRTLPVRIDLRQSSP
jgi:hypothetical protein